MTNMTRWVELTTARLPSGEIAVNLCVCAWDGSTPPAKDAVPAYRGAARPAKTYNAFKVVTGFVRGVYLQGAVAADPEEDTLLAVFFEPGLASLTMWDMEDAVRAMHVLYGAAWPRDVTPATVGGQVSELVRRLDLTGVVVHRRPGEYQAIADRAVIGSAVDELIERIREAMIQEGVG